MKRTGVDRLVKLGMLTALSILILYIVPRPKLFTDFLEYDAADVPILIGTFLYGPLWGLLLTLAVCVLQGMTVSAASGGPIGILMHFFATGSFVLVAGLIYRRFHTLRGALIALVCGSLTMIALMVPLNLVFTPLFMKVPVEVVKPMLWSAILPFNAVKAGLNSVLTLLVYKSIGRLLKKELRFEKSGAPEKHEQV